VVAWPSAEQTVLSGAQRPTPFQYRLWGHRIISDLDLGDLGPVSESGCVHGTLFLKLAAEKDCPQPEGRALLEHRFENGDIWFASWKSEDGYIARFPELCIFRIQPEQMQIECTPQPGVAESTIAHLILDHAIPRVLALRPGYLVLHASSIQIEGQVIAILGPSGQGKSTLAAWFASQGFPLLTDDCLVLRKDESTRQWLAQPSYQSVRLWPDSIDALRIDASGLQEFAHYSSKRRTGKAADFRFATSDFPLSGCFVLAGPRGSGAPNVSALPVNEAFLALARAVFRLEADNEQINRREFEVLTTLLDTVPFWSLSYERCYASLPGVEKAIIETMREY
jgi:hypothetical protein